jgi:RimJ/RimL family protein N-acetyltransferase
MPEFDFSSFPTLFTPRLILRESVPDDAEDIFSYLSNPKVQKNEDGTYQNWELFGMLESEYQN